MVAVAATGLIEAAHRPFDPLYHQNAPKQYNSDHQNQQRGVMDILAPSAPPTDLGREKRAVVSGSIAAGTLLYKTRCLWNPFSRSFWSCGK